jgi:hypothetical protein
VDSVLFLVVYFVRRLGGRGGDAANLNTAMSGNSLHRLISRMLRRPIRLVYADESMAVLTAMSKHDWFRALRVSWP